MTGELVRADGRGSMTDTREIVRCALSTSADWSPAELMDQPLAVHGALADLRGALVPAKRADPKAESEDAQRLVRQIGKIGIKLNPTMAEDATQRWAATIVEALADLPYAVTLRATRDAIHTPVRFFAEVETAIRAAAEPHEAAYRMAQSRMERLIEEIERAQRPQTALPPPREVRPMTQADVDRMVGAPEGSLQRTLLGLGIGCGSILELEDGRYCLNPEA